MVLEIANPAGRGAYHRDSSVVIEMAGRAIGARPIPHAFEDTGGSSRRQRWADQSDSFVAAGAYGGHTLSAPATSTLPAEVLTHDPALRFPPGRRVFTDGSLIANVGVGAAYYSERTDAIAYVKVPEGEDINNAELTGLLQAVQDEAGQGGTLHIFTDSLTSLRQMRKWVFGPMGEFGQYTTALLSSMVRALIDGSQSVGVHKQRAHAGQKGNEMADGGAKNVAAGKAGKMQLRAPTLNGAVSAGQWEPHLHVDGIPITRAKKQLRNRITDWLASHRGYRCTVQDMWAGEEAAKLDKQASTEAVWGMVGILVDDYCC